MLTSPSVGRPVDPPDLVSPESLKRLLFQIYPHLEPASNASPYQLLCLVRGK
jgi:hypothetical protein